MSDKASKHAVYILETNLTNELKQQVQSINQMIEKNEKKFKEHVNVFDEFKTVLS